MLTKCSIAAPILLEVPGEGPAERRRDQPRQLRAMRDPRQLRTTTTQGHERSTTATQGHDNSGPDHDWAQLFSVVRGNALTACATRASRSLVPSIIAKVAGSISVAVKLRAAHHKTSQSQNITFKAYISKKSPTVDLKVGRDKITDSCGVEEIQLYENINHLHSKRPS